MKSEDLNIYTTYKDWPNPPFAEWDKTAGTILRETMNKYYQFVVAPDKDPTTTSAYQDLMRTIGTGSEQLNTWKAYIEQLRAYFPDSEIQRDIKLQPGVGAIFTLKDDTYDGFTITQKLHTYHSLLGPFYTIFGVNRVLYNNGEYNSMVFDPIITASPIDEYKALFEAVHKQFQKDFPDRIFMPFQIGRQTYPGFRTGWVSHKGDHALLHALFTHYNIVRCAFRGDLTYGYKEWTDRELRAWTAYPPNHPPK